MDLWGFVVPSPMQVGNTQPWEEMFLRADRCLGVNTLPPAEWHLALIEYLQKPREIYGEDLIKDIQIIFDGPIEDKMFRSKPLPGLWKASCDDWQNWKRILAIVAQEKKRTERGSSTNGSQNKDAEENLHYGHTVAAQFFLKRLGKEPDFEKSSLYQAIAADKTMYTFMQALLAGLAAPFSNYLHKELVYTVLMDCLNIFIPINLHETLPGIPEAFGQLNPSRQASFLMDLKPSVKPTVLKYLVKVEFGSTCIWCQLPPIEQFFDFTPKGAKKQATRSAKKDPDANKMTGAQILRMLTLALHSVLTILDQTLGSETAKPKQQCEAMVQALKKSENWQHDMKPVLGFLEGDDEINQGRILLYGIAKNMKFAARAIFSQHGFKHDV